MRKPRQNASKRSAACRQDDPLKVKALSMQIEAGVDALERGEFTEVDEADLDHYLEGLTVNAHACGSAQ
jgi:hypothetical protein